jgi:peptide/nickel transport system permease protein
MGLKGYIARRLVYSIVLIFAVLTVNFLIFTLLPGDPTNQYVTTLAKRITEEDLARLRSYYGLDKPLHERYFLYLNNMLTWDFGRGFSRGRSFVYDSIMQRLPNTILLMGLDAVISTIVGILLGVVAAYKRDTILDTGMVTASLITFSVPIFFIGWMVIFLFSVNLGWFPANGTFPREWGRTPPTSSFEFVVGRLSYIVLPTLTLFLFSVGGWILLTRACVLETITEDYVVTARAKGLKERTVLYKHILKNAALPLITNVAMTFGFLMSGAIITETLFGYGGMGLLIWDALHPPDLPVLQAVFYVIALCVIVANLVADLLYGIIDPRIKYG